MKTGIRAWVLNALVTGVAGLAGLPLQARADEPLALRWDQLYLRQGDGADAHVLFDKFAGRNSCSAETAKLSKLSDLVVMYNGQRIVISGFIVALDDDSKPLNRFLLIPFAGGCESFPPPANQVILVTLDKPKNLEKVYDPVEITGVINANPTKTKLGEAGYRLSADTIALAR